jgi:hypothetical protein
MILVALPETNSDNRKTDIREKRNKRTWVKRRRQKE